MIELKSDMCWRTFYLDSKPKIWFKRVKDETMHQWLARVSYPAGGALERLEWYEANESWVGDSGRIAYKILDFMRVNKVSKTDFETMCQFELNLKGTHNWTLSELKTLEHLMNIKLINI